MTKEELQELVGQHVRVTAEFVNRHSILTGVRDREGGLPGEVWADFEDGYSILNTAKDLAVVLYVEGEELNNEVTYVEP